MDVLSETLGFAAKALVVFLTVAASAVVLAMAARAGRRRGQRTPPHGRLRIVPINGRMRALADALRRATMPAKAYKALLKSRAAEEKAEAKDPKPSTNVYVLDFDGDIMASAVDNLREEVSAIVGAAEEGDEVVLRLESGGGAAHSYGLAASQLARLRDAGVHLTVCVDKVAASGGYMMACVADEILAAPFAIVGSIGVAAPLPNVHRLLDRLGVDYEDATAGEHKRTVSALAEVSPEGRQKFQEQLEETHTLFKDFVKRFRPSLDVDRVATGEYWHGIAALELGLVNRLTTSDDYLMTRLDGARLFEVRFTRQRAWRDRFAGTLSLAIERTVLRLLSRARLLSAAR